MQLIFLCCKYKKKNAKPDYLNDNRGYLLQCAFFSGAAPKLIGVPRNQSADIGANVTFNCTASGFPKPTISWIKNNDSSALQSNLRVKFINSPMDDKSIQSQLLLIIGVKMEDFGKYQCKAESVVGKNLSLPAFLTPKGSGETCTCAVVNWFQRVPTLCLTSFYK